MSRREFHFPRRPRLSQHPSSSCRLHSLESYRHVNSCAQHLGYTRESSSLGELFRVSSRFRHLYVGNPRIRQNYSNHRRIIGLSCECDERHWYHSIGEYPSLLIGVRLDPLLVSSRLMYPQEVLGLYPSYSQYERNEPMHVQEVGRHSSIPLRLRNIQALILFRLHLSVRWISLHGVGLVSIQGSRLPEGSFLVARSFHSCHGCPRLVFPSNCRRLLPLNRYLEYRHPP